MRGNVKQRGFTLTELMVTVAVIAILAAIAYPSFTDQMRSRRVKGAAEGLAAALQNAKAQAVMSNADMRIIFTPAAGGATWCYAMTDLADCDCTAGTCTVDGAATGTLVQSTNFPEVSVSSITTSNIRTFTPLRGGSNGGTVTFTGPNNLSLGVVVSTLGRIRICKPAGSALVGYTDSGACP